jgi:hypothetical protein
MHDVMLQYGSSFPGIPYSPILQLWPVNGPTEKYPGAGFPAFEVHCNGTHAPLQYAVTE